MMRKKPIFLVVLLRILFILLALVGIFYLYTLVYYKAIDCDSYMESSPLVSVAETNSYYSFYGKDEEYKVLTIYPGAKVEAKAYSPLAYSIASMGYHVYIIKMPLNFAFFNMNAMDEILALEASRANSFYMAGHSLGGATMALYIANHPEKIEGAIYLASFSSSDLSNSKTKALSIYGSNDLVLNKNSYEKYKVNQPKDFTEVIIEGGCHSYFASYGNQKFDGTPEITKEEQIAQTKEAIVDFMKN